MKPSILRTALAGLAIGLSFIVNPAAMAMPKLTREKCGVVERINYETHTLTIRPSEGGDPLVVVWKERTRFVRNATFDSAESLTEGRKVCIRYRWPFFGKKFATRVIWSNGMSRDKS